MTYKHKLTIFDYINIPLKLIFVLHEIYKHMNEMSSTVVCSIGVACLRREKSSLNLGKFGR